MKISTKLTLILFSQLMVDNLYADEIYKNHNIVQNIDIEEEAGFDDFEDFEEEESAEEVDYLSGYNKIMTDINATIYDYLLIPVAKTYDYVLPELVQDGIYNFFENLQYPLSVTSNLLQLEFVDAFTETERFVINTTIGVGGLFDPATDWFEIDKNFEDLGQTFGTYGIGAGCHIVIPILGPSNIRDLTGDILNWTFNPIYFNESRGYNVFNQNVSIGTTVLDNMATSDANLKYYQNIISTKYSKYIELKTFYEENRKKLIKE